MKNNLKNWLSVLILIVLSAYLKTYTINHNLVLSNLSKTIILVIMIFFIIYNTIKYTLYYKHKINIISILKIILLLTIILILNVCFKETVEDNYLKITDNLKNTEKFYETNHFVRNYYPTYIKYYNNTISLDNYIYTTYYDIVGNPTKTINEKTHERISTINKRRVKMNLPEIIYTTNIDNTIYRIVRTDYILGQKQIIKVQKLINKTFKDITNQVTINNSASFKFLTKDLGYINNNSNIKPLKVITSTSKDIIDAQINLDKYLLESLNILDFPTKKDNIYIMNVSVYENSKIKEITLESEDGITWNQQQ